MAKPDMKQLVQFTIPSHRISNTATEEAGYRLLIKEVFGESLGRGKWKDLTFICRLDQFALFLIRRHQVGLQNMYAELDVKLVGNTQPPVIINVSDN